MSEKNSPVKLADICGQDLYLVIKRDDIERLDLQHKVYVAKALEEIKQTRKRQGKAPNKYWVVNQDEPYADSVKALIFGLAPNTHLLHRAAATLIGLRRAAKLDLEDAKKKKDVLREIQAATQLADLREAIEVFEELARPYLKPESVIVDENHNTPAGEGEEGG